MSFQRLQLANDRRDDHVPLPAAETTAKRGAPRECGRDKSGGGTEHDNDEVRSEKAVASEAGELGVRQQRVPLRVNGTRHHHTKYN